MIDSIYVSTDDPEIGSISEELGVEIIKRSSELSNDVATTLEVMSHAVQNLPIKSSPIDRNIFCIYPINPFLSENYMNTALELISTHDIDYVFTAKAFTSPIQRALRVDELGNAQMIDIAKSSIRTQDLETSYHDAGMFYLANLNSWATMKPIFDGRGRFIEIGKYESIDVDEEEDWEMMEKLNLIRKQGKN
jgi:N-acylneuraminate cytidylyltransferase